jgi:hypothetical protein
MAAPSCEPPTTPGAEPDGLREFLLVLRRALLLVVDYIERRYDLPRWKPRG